MCSKKRVGQKIYNTGKWRSTRQAYYTHQHGICEWCGSPGDIVDHIEELSEENINDPYIAFGWDNLQLLCLTCHNRKTFRKYKAVGEGYMFDSEGNLIFSKP